MPTMASGLATVQLPPVAAWMSLPLDSGVGDRGEDRVDAHLHGRLALEPPERMQADADDGYVVGHVSTPVSEAGQAGAKAKSIYQL